MFGVVVWLVGLAASVARLASHQADHSTTLPTRTRTGRLDCRLRLAHHAAMPTNHTKATQLSARLSRLAVEAQRIADQLAAEPLDEYEAELELGLPSFQLAKVVAQLEDAIFSAAWESPAHRAHDLAIARTIAEGSDASAIPALR